MEKYNSPRRTQERPNTLSLVVSQESCHASFSEGETVGSDKSITLLLHLHRRERDFSFLLWAQKCGRVTPILPGLSLALFPAGSVKPLSLTHLLSHFMVSQQH